MEQKVTEFKSFQQEALNELTSSNHLKQLPTDSYELARQVANNPSASPELLQKLSTSSDAVTRFHAAANPNTPTDVLWKLGAEFPLQLLDNPVFSLLLLENPNLVETIPLNTLLSLLKQDSVPVSFLEWAANQSHEGIQLAVAMNAHTPKTVLEKLLERKQPDIIEAVQLHVNIAGEMKEGWDEAALEAIANQTFYEKERGYLERLAHRNLFPDFVIQQLPVELRCTVAKHTNTSAKVLEQLASDEDGKVRENVANNPTTPSKILWQLAVDEWASIREVVAKRLGSLENKLNFNITNQEFSQAVVKGDARIPYAISLRLAQSPDSIETALEQLATDKDGDIRYLVARTPGISVKLLEQLAQDEIESVRLAVARNPSTPGNILEQLLDDKALRVCQVARQCAIAWYIAHKPDELPEHLLPIVLECYAKNSESSLIRLCALRHPQTPAKVLSENCGSPVWRERYAIAQHPHTPLDTLHTLATDANRIVRAAARANLQHRQ